MFKDRNEKMKLPTTVMKERFQRQRNSEEYKKCKF